MPRLQTLALAALLTFWLAACALRVEGNGVFAEKTITVEAFQRVEIGLGIEATITSHAGAVEVVLSGDENVLPEIEVTVASDTLHTAKLSSFTSLHPLRLRIFVPDLVAVAATEGARVTVSGAATDTFLVAASQQSLVALSGPGGAAMTVALTDGSSLSAFSYPVAGATVAISSGSAAQLHSSGPVTGSVTGGPRGSSRVEIQGGGACTATLASGSTCGPASP